MKVIKMDNITRKFIKDNPQYLFLFGDNLEGKGMGGQAKEMRGEKNAHGIPTKIAPNMSEMAFFVDDMLEEVQSLYDDLFLFIQAGIKAGKYKAIVIPSAGLGTGLAELPTRAPKIYEYLNMKLKEMENY